MKVSKSRKMKNPTFIKIDSKTKKGMKQKKGSRTYDEYIREIAGL